MIEQIKPGREQGYHTGTPPQPPSKHAGMDSECGGLLSDLPYTTEVVDSRLGTALARKKAREGEKRGDEEL